MESLVISIVIGLTIIIAFMPIDKMMYRKNLHKLILSINQVEYKTSINKDSFKDRILVFAEKMYKKFNIKISKEMHDKYQNKLVLSNMNDKLSVECVLGMKILTSVFVFFYIGLLTVINVSFMMIMLLIIATVLAYYCPDNMLNIRIKKRQQQLQRELPNVLKTLAITTEAGLNFWEAIKKVCEIKKGALVDELGNMLDEINMGVLQKEALMKFSERCMVTEITVFVFTIMQSLEKGSAGITKALNEQANEVWEIRKSKAKELGQKASVKLFFSMLVFVFPSLLIFLLGPAIMSILKLFIQ